MCCDRSRIVIYVQSWPFPDTTLGNHWSTESSRSRRPSSASFAARCGRYPPPDPPQVSRQEGRQHSPRRLALLVAADESNDPQLRQQRLPLRPPQRIVHVQLPTATMSAFLRPVALSIAEPTFVLDDAPDLLRDERPSPIFCLSTLDQAGVRMRWRESLLAHEVAF